MLDWQDGGGVELHFGVSTLPEVRAAVAAAAAVAGLPAGRVGDVVLAVHELAANAVRHGAGQGRLAVYVTAGALCCEVSDAGRARLDGAAVRGTGSGPGTRAAGRPPWAVEPGHGLWLVRQVCDEVQVVSGSDGSRVTVMFSLPAARQSSPENRDSSDSSSGRGERS